MVSRKTRGPDREPSGVEGNGDPAVEVQPSGDPALIHREELYRALVEQAGEGIWLTDPEGRILEVNESAGRSLGYPREELIGRRITELFHPEDVQRREELLLRLRSGEIVVAERRARRPDGSEVILEGTGRMLDSGCLLTVTHDVTERRRVEQELRQSEARLRLIADAMPALISYVDTEQRYRFNNRAYDDWFGIHPAQIEGRTMHEVLGDAACERLLPHVEAALAGERVAFESWLPYREGGERHVSADYVPDIDEMGRVRGFYALVTDISHRKEAEEALRQADRAKDEFLAILAHELRNPLAPIVTAAQVVKLRGPEDPAIRRQAEIIERQAKHLARMVDDLLDISRVTAGKVQLRRERVALGPLVEQAVGSTRPLFDERGHTLTVKIPGDPVTVDVDPTRLVQILVNLLNNAGKYTPSGGRISVTVEPDLPLAGAPAVSGQLAGADLDSHPDGSGPACENPDLFFRPAARSCRPPAYLSPPAGGASDSEMETGGPAPGMRGPRAGSLEAEARQFVSVRVRDSGVGISAELMSQLFELFVQGERSLARTDGGLGVGLALVKRLVEMHQGTIEARSDGPGLGSEFILRLPQVPVSPRSPAPNRSPTEG